MLNRSPWGYRLSLLNSGADYVPDFLCCFAVTRLGCGMTHCVIIWLNRRDKPMFGYVQPFKPELKLKEYEAYKGYYCGLCKAIKENYTNSARFMLNYDCATLLLLLASMSDQMPRVVRERCVVSPLKKKTIVRADESLYAASVNVLLGCAKLSDAVRDDGKLSARLLLLLYKRTGKRAQSAHMALAEEFAKRLERLDALERRGCADIDTAADEFAHMLAAVFAGAPFKGACEATKKALWHFGYNIGRWIYIADAVNDIEKDIKTKNYNVFVQRVGADADVRAAVREEASYNLNMTLAQAVKAYELLDIKRDKPLLDNIVYLGLAKKTQEVLKGEIDGPV